MDKIDAVLEKIDGYVWGIPLIVLILAVGLLLTIRTGLIQVRHLPKALRYMLKNEEGGEGDVTSFGALCTALSATIGTGNIVGVATAIAAGGPGALFWMEVAAFLGMATKYSEGLLAVKYREIDSDGRILGGPFYYIEKGMCKNWKWLAVLFAILGGIASFGIGNISQATEIAGAMEGLFGIKPLVTGIILAALVAVVVIGGIKRIGQVTSYLVPFMAIFYIIAGIGVIVLRIGEIPSALVQIFKGAFSFKSVGGGIFGYVIMQAMRQGFARGVFSNEAGLGSAPMAHAASSTEQPVEQALWGIFEVFVDTIVICTITALAVILSGVLGTEGGLDAFSSKGAAAVEAFNVILPGTVGGTVIQVSLLFFALSTILGWSYYGLTCWSYLTNGNKVVAFVYKVVFILVCIVGSVGSGKLMWDISDTLNGLMALPNLVALILLSGVVGRETKKYFDKYDFDRLKK